LDDNAKSLLEFTRKLVELRRQHPNLHRRKFFQDRPIAPASTPELQVDGRVEHDITWLRPDGMQMTPEEWNAGWVRCIGLMLNGRTLEDINGVGEPVLDETFLLMLNPHTEAIKFYMPPQQGTAWEVVLDSCCPGREEKPIIKAAEFYELIPRSIALLREMRD
jgi:glycogen operon protein